MIPMAAILLFQAGWTEVRVDGGAQADAAALASYLGPAYQVRYVSAGKSAVVTNPSPPRRGTPSRSLLLLVPDTASSAKGIDAWVTRLRQRVRSEKGAANLEIYLCVPAPAGAEASAVGSYFAPLARQVAREEGVKTIDLSTAPSFAEAVGDAIVDQRIEKKGWRVVSFDSQQIDEGPAADAIDGRLDTYWHTQYDPTSPKHPHEIVVDTGTSQSIAGFRYVPRQDGGVNGRVKDFELYLSPDGQSWGAPVLSGPVPNTSKPTHWRFERPVTARYFRFVAKSEQNGGPWTTAAELDILRARP